MDSLSGLLAFVRTVEVQSFVAAGERLGISASAVGKSVARLEDKLGVRLLNRSTRRLRLTEEGAMFFERCRRIVEDIAEAEAELSRLLEAPRGKLRVSVPAIGYRMLMPILPEFTRRYPDVELDLDFNDRLIDVIADGVDVVIRSGEIASSQLKMRPLGSFRFVLVGAASYFAARGVPRTPEDLAQHACLRYRFPTTGQLQAWTVEGNAPDLPLRIPATFTFNNVEALIAAATAGLGIAYVPDFAVRESLNAGALRRVLGDYTTDGGRFSMLWPGSRHLLPKLRVFVDFVAERLVLGP